MKYIKSYEKLIRNTDPRVLNHPLLEFTDLLKEILSNIHKLDQKYWENDTAKVARYFSDKNDITINYDVRLRIKLSLVKDNVTMSVNYGSFFINNVNKNSIEFFNFLDEELRNYYSNENNDGFRHLEVFNFKMKDIKHISHILNDYKEKLKMLLSTEKYNL